MKDYFEMCENVPAEPSYLPTRWVGIERVKRGSVYHTGYAVDRSVTSKHAEYNVHILHDMPADKDGVQVDFVTLAEAGYTILPLGCGQASWRHVELNCGWNDCESTIDAWRAAAVHYLANKK